jgi:hypothetical protein
LIENIRLAKKLFLGTNALAYFDNEKEKKFCNVGHWGPYNKTFMAVIKADVL